MWDQSGFDLTPNPIEYAPSSAQDEAGGYVVFEGRVRNLNEGREVRSLEYEAFGEMAVKTGNEVLDEARKLFPILGVRCVHRTGHLQIGDTAIRVEVASTHRKAAFEACDWIVNEVKRRVPIWKKEHYADGDSGWINCEPPKSRVESQVSKVQNSKFKVQSPKSEMAYYSRQITLAEVGEEGQAKLGKARVLVVGAGGLGSPALLYLAAAGVGNLGIAEFDDLDESNLHRQILYSSEDIGQEKAEAAATRLRAFNPHIEVIPHHERVTPANVADLIAGYDLVLDCTDNFRTKFLLNDACVQAAKALIQASIYRYEGQLLVIESGSPCLRCLWPETPVEGCVGSCAEVGVLGVVPGVFGTLQAAEAVKFILGMPSPLREGKMLLLDLLSYQQHLVTLAKNPDCPACGRSEIRNPKSEIQDPKYEVEACEIDFADFVVVDVREPYELRMQPFDAALNLPSTRFDPSALPEAGRYLLVCAHGVRSASLAETMWEHGDRRFFSLVGGVAGMPSHRQ
ncbi:MAG: ThiF family adenylyltransferase [Fimbriimonadales bacterium]